MSDTLASPRVPASRTAQSSSGSPLTVRDWGLVACVIAREDAGPARKREISVNRDLLTTMIGIVAARVPDEAAELNKDVIEPKIWLDVAGELPFTTWSTPIRQKGTNDLTLSPEQIIRSVTDPAVKTIVGDSSAIRCRSLCAAGALMRHAYTPGRTGPFCATILTGMVSIDERTKAVEDILQVLSVKATPVAVASTWQDPLWRDGRFSWQSVSARAVVNNNILSDPGKKRKWQEFLEDVEVADVTTAHLYTETQILR